MACGKCTVRQIGQVIEVDNKGCCIWCGEFIASSCLAPTDEVEKVKRWDKYFHDLCIAVSSKSPCLSRKIGAILVRNNSIVSTGFNGPARGYPHCEGSLFQGFKEGKIVKEFQMCPRHAKGYKSGEHLDECPAAHAEANCIANAARLGVSTLNTTLYMNCIVPCKDCAAALVNAGITEIVIEGHEFYHKMSEGIFRNGNIKIRSFL